jgi:hypothetical protein
MLNFKIQKMKNRTKIIFLISIVFLIGLSVFLFSRFTHYQGIAMESQQRYQEAFSGYKYLAEANSLLLQNKYEEALAVYSQADSILPHQPRWQELSKTYIQQTRLNKDSLQQFKDEFESLQQKIRLIAEKNNVTQEYIDQLQQRTSNDSAQLQGFAVANQLLSLMVGNLKNELTSAKGELETAKTAYGKLDFETAKGVDVHYFGEISNGMANGFGIGVFGSKSIYEGEWQNNLRHGTGKYVWANGDIYEGTFNEGKREGEGTYAFASGEKYVGQWQNDVREGKGIVYSPEGKVMLDGMWQNDKFLKDPLKQKESAQDTIPAGNLTLPYGTADAEPL